MPLNTRNIPVTVGDTTNDEGFRVFRVVGGVYKEPAVEGETVDIPAHFNDFAEQKRVTSANE